MVLGVAWDRIAVVSYDPDWPMAYQAECERILRAVGGARFILEHVGSTSVPALAAKPIIDIMIGLDTLEHAALLLHPLQGLGYDYMSELETVMPERRFLRRIQSGKRTHHIHMVAWGSDFWERHLAFREFLRAHPEQAQTYGRLKLALASAYPDAPEAYIDGKSPLINELETIALAWFKQPADRG